jgi:radical SAM superfamily enzyme YgiQ (UPF0313 family)
MTLPPGCWSDADRANKLVLLVNARSEPEQPDLGRLLGVPLGVLVLAQELREEGFDVHIIDQSVQADFRPRMRALPRPIFVGISCDGGEQIIGGREVAEFARKLWPGIPRVWGGWGPTLSPDLYEHPTSARWIDAFGRGRGNVAIRALAHAFVEHRGLDGIASITWRDADGGIHRNVDNPRNLPTTRAPMPYELVDWDRYMTDVGILNYIAASGCPHRCSFCSIPTGLPDFDPMENEVVIDHLRLAHRRGIKYIVFFDDNFFTSKKRVLDLAQRLVDSGMGLQWHSNGRVDQLHKMSAENFELLRASGCTYLNVGLETGDQETSDHVHKDIDVQEMFEVARRCQRVGIGLTVNFIIGLPGETPEAQVRSFKVLEELYSIQPKMYVYWHLYLPCPGTPLWREHIADGTLVEPKTLDEMLKLGRYVSEQAGYYARAPKRLFSLDQDRNQAIGWYFYHGYAAPLGAGPLRPLRKLLQRWCRWRYDSRYFRYNADWLVFYWPRRALRRWLWIRRDLVRNFSFLKLALFPGRAPKHRCHFTLLFEPGWKVEDAPPVGGSGGAARLRSAPAPTMCE